MPAPVESARNVVLLVVDGLGWHQLQAHKQFMPTLSSMVGAAITTVAPTTTVTALTSITTGLAPGEHGMMGYRMDMGRQVVQMLRWGDDKGDLRSLYPPEIVQPTPPFMGSSVPVVSKAEFDSTAFTAAHLRGTRSYGWRAASSIAVTVGSLLRGGQQFVYAYYDGVDKIAHERGFGEFYEAELRTVDRLIGDIAEQLTPDSVLLVTADHGQVHVGTNTIVPHADVVAGVAYQSGEGRFRWLHTKGGATEDVLAAAKSHYADVAWIVSRDEAIDGGWFGPRVTDAARKRLGDVALLPFTDTSFEDAGDTGPFQLVCRHGSLTEAEVDVPLLAFRSNA
jgi:predicted AlkP superfamily pyrophosphatase or phosphodiesterase